MRERNDIDTIFSHSL